MKTAMTIRAEPQLKEFFEIQADNLGVSLHDFIIMTLRSVMHASLPQVNTEIDLCSERFVDAFKKHDIPVIDIPKFFKEGEILRSDLKSSDSLLNKLSESVLRRTSELFSISIDWLKGSSNTISNCYEKAYNSFWYKETQSLLERIRQHKDSGKKVEVLIFTTEETLNYITEATYLHGEEHGENEIPVNITLKISNPNLNYTFYELFDQEPWNYRPVRLTLKALVLYFEKNRIHFTNICVPEKVFDKMMESSIFVSDAIKGHKHSSKVKFHKFCEDKPSNPEKKELLGVEGRYIEKISPYESTCQRQGN
ncbi:MAG: hypothetical protein HRU43_00070 [Simkaniaceae bacterium]|nr:hypothetical protein [Simkaniaceae bacterium]